MAIGTERLRVALDGTDLSAPTTTAGRRLTSLIGALVQRPELSVRCYALGGKSKQRAMMLPDSVGTEQKVMPQRFLRAVWSRLDHPRLERFVPPVDVVHGTSLVVPPSSRARRVVSVWDLTFVQFPEEIGGDARRLERLFRRALRTGVVVHAATNVIANEVRERFDARRDQVVTVYPGVLALPEPDQASAAALVDPLGPYILSVGASHLRSGHAELVAAFDALATEHPDLRLVLVGPKGISDTAFEAAIEGSHASARIHQTGAINDAVFAALLRGARVLASNTFDAGFAFPPLQAMTHGIPVVATHLGSASEITGGAALLVAPGDLDDLAGALEVAVGDEAQRSALITAGWSRATDFTWEKTAEGLSALYRRFAGV